MSRRQLFLLAIPIVLLLANDRAIGAESSATCSNKEGNDRRGAYTDPLTPFSSLPWVEQRPVARRTFTSWPAIYASPAEPLLLDGLLDNAEVQSWKAWRRWTPDNLRRVRDSFSNVNVLHSSRSARWVCYVNKATERSRAVWGDLPPAYAAQPGRTSVRAFFDGCDTAAPGAGAGSRPARLFYLTGTNHPQFDDDTAPHAATFPGFARKYMYWACEGVVSHVHYDAQPIVLVQVHGDKDMLLLPPAAAADALYFYPSSHVAARRTMLRLAPGEPPLNATRWPRLRRLRWYQHVRLRPGDALYLPPYWLHSIGIPRGRGPSLGLSFKNDDFVPRSEHYTPMRDSVERAFQHLHVAMPLAERDRAVQLLAVTSSILAQVAMPGDSRGGGGAFEEEEDDGDEAEDKTGALLLNFFDTVLDPIVAGSFAPLVEAWGKPSDDDDFVPPLRPLAGRPIAFADADGEECVQLTVAAAHDVLAPDPALLRVREAVAAAGARAARLEAETPQYADGVFDIWVHEMMSSLATVTTVFGDRGPRAPHALHALWRCLRASRPLFADLLAAMREEIARLPHASIPETGAAAITDPIDDEEVIGAADGHRQLCFCEDFLPRKGDPPGLPTPPQIPLEAPIFAVLRAGGHVGSNWIAQLLSSQDVAMYFESDGLCNDPSDGAESATLTRGPRRTHRVQGGVPELALGFLVNAGCRCALPFIRAGNEDSSGHVHESDFCEGDDIRYGGEFFAACREDPDPRCRGIGLMSVNPPGAILPWLCDDHGDDDCSACWCAGVVKGIKIVTLERDNAAKCAFSVLKQTAADAQRVRKLDGTAAMQNHAIATRVEKDARVRQFYHVEPMIFMLLLWRSINIRAKWWNVVRDLAIAYEAHYEDFQRAPAEETRKLLRAVGILDSDGGAPGGPPSGRTVKSGPESLASVILNFGAISSFLLAQWPCVHPQFVSKVPERFDVCPFPLSWGNEPPGGGWEGYREMYRETGVGLRLLECKWPADGMPACLFTQQQTCVFGGMNNVNDSRCRDLAATEACGEEDEQRCKEAVALAGRGARSRVSVFSQLDEPHA